jgi:hypothetical protein
MTSSEGTKFKTKLIAENLQNKVKENDVIRYKFRSVSPSGNPAHPQIYQIRHDLSWDQVLSNQARNDKLKSMANFVTFANI